MIIPALPAGKHACQSFYEGCLMRQVLTWGCPATPGSCGGMPGWLYPCMPLAEGGRGMPPAAAAAAACT